MDELDPEVVLIRQIKRRRVVLAIGIGLVACVAMYPCCSVTCQMGREMSESAERRAEYDHEASPEQRDAVERALAAAQAGLPARNAEFTRATADIASLVPRPDLGPCPIHVPLRAPGSAQTGYSVNNLDEFEALGLPGRQTFPWARTPIGADAPRVVYARERISDLRAAIARHDTVESLAGVVTAAQSLSTTFWTWDVVIVPETWQMPSVDPTGSTFDGGYVSGTAFVHDYASQSVVCAGWFEATTTSEVVDYRAGLLDQGTTLAGMLQAEMESEIERAISRAIVYRAGPPLAPPTSEDDGAPR